METYSRYVIFDEVKYVLELFNYIKIVVENNGQKYEI
jgi:hypothetical protein